MYQAVVFVEIGDGRESFFWEDRWLQGWRIQEIAPLVYVKIKPQIRASRMVADAMAGAWARDLGPDLTHAELAQFLLLWDTLASVELHTGITDSVRWAWETSGAFSAQSAYASKFIGCEHDIAASFTWRSRTPLRCKFFSWLILKNRVWTYDRLARRGLPHQAVCPMCE